MRPENNLLALGWEFKADAAFSTFFPVSSSFSLVFDPFLRAGFLSALGAGGAHSDASKPQSAADDSVAAQEV